MLLLMLLSRALPPFTVSIMTTPMQTNHTTSGRTVMSTHKYYFYPKGDWALTSDNYPGFCFDPAQTGHKVFHYTLLGYPIGQTFVAHNHENTTTVLQRLEDVGMIKCYADPSMMGCHTLYTQGGPVVPDAPLIEVPCNMAPPPAGTEHHILRRDRRHAQGETRGRSERELRLQD